MTQAAGKTGSAPTVTVAIEQRFPPEQRLVEDGLAQAILPFPMRAFVALSRLPFVRNWMVNALENHAPGLWGGLMSRKRYIDELLLASVSQVEALVNLGAGFDTRPYRFPALGDLPTWEVDQPINIEAKRARLHQLFGGVPPHVTLVPLDLDRERLETALARHGYSMEQPTFVIWEAVTQYLTDGAIRGTFDFLAEAAPGSRLVFTYIRQDFLAGREMYGQEALYRRYITRDKLWLFGMEPERIAAFLGKYGWRLVEHPTPNDLAERYITPTGRALASFPIERIAYAEKN